MCVSGRRVSDILRRIAIKGPFASEGAEGISLALVLRFPGCIFGIHTHPANRIFFHINVGSTSFENYSKMIQLLTLVYALSIKG